MTYLHGKIKDLRGQKFGQLTVTEYMGKNHEFRALWKCLCDCGGEKVTTSQRLKNGDCTTCGCNPKRTFKDLTGQRFGKLTAISLCEKLYNRKAWLCKCDCGKETKITSNALVQGKANSCGCECYQNLDLSGRKYGRLKVISKFDKGKNGSWYYLCNCDCGKECLVNVGQLNDGRTKSCGCLSREVASKKGSTLVGSNNPRWKGGITPEQKLLRGSKAYKLWRKQVLYRDRRCCQLCGETKKLHAHHILSYIDTPEYRLNPDNGITLCENCHVYFHMIYGYGDNTPEQLKEFMASFGV